MLVSTAFLAILLMIVCVQRRCLGLYVDRSNTFQSQILWLTMCDIFIPIPELSILIQKVSNPIRATEVIPLQRRHWR